jgi:hypothetical protein
MCNPLEAGARAGDQNRILQRKLPSGRGSKLERLGLLVFSYFRFSFVQKAEDRRVHWLMDGLNTEGRH